MRATLAGLLCSIVAGCSEAPAPLALGEPLPAQLSALGVLAHDGDTLRPIAGVAYALGVPLFSDYAQKYRTVHLPPGAAAQRVGDDATTLAFPVGTLITKTFSYPTGAANTVRLQEAAAFDGAAAPLALANRRLVETRVLRHRPDGWEAVSYLWNEAGSDARKARAGALLELVAEDGSSFDYLVPDMNQCAGCHGAEALKPIGPKPGNLAAVTLDPGHGDQYQHWLREGWVGGAPAAPWATDGAAAAPAYLDANCAHCHSAVGAADTAGIDLRHGANDVARGRCKAPVAAGRGSGGRAYDIWPGRPEASILVYRLEHTDPGVLMPELGRTLVHDRGATTIRSWIEQLEGDCDAGALL